MPRRLLAGSTLRASVFAVTVAVSFAAISTGFTELRAGASTGAHGASICGWKVVTGSKVSSTESYRGNEPIETLRGVTALSQTDVWIVGQSIAHWNGKRWRVYKPVRAGRDQSLFAITAASAKNIWVVGGDQGVAIGDGEVGSLIDHWNGRSWARVRHIPTTAFLSSAAVMPNHHLWAGGGKWAGDGDYEAYVVHWNGRRWVGSTPPFGDPDPLTGIAPISPTDVLTVGHNNAYAAKWNGKRWAVLDSPVFANAITAVSPNDAWAVGEGNAGSIEHWNGIGWSAVPFTLARGWSPTFESVSASGRDNVWAVGQMYLINSAGQIVQEQALTAHWNGTQWIRTAIPEPHAVLSELVGVSALPNGDAWAVGGYGRGFSSNLHPLIERYSRC